MQPLLLFTLLFFVFATCGVTSVSAFSDPHYPNTFENRDTLRQWALHSAMGGAVMDIYLEGMPGMQIAMRSYTSGVLSSDLAVYVLRNDGVEELVKYYPKVVRDSIDVTISTGGRALLVFSNANGTKEEIAELTRDDLFYRRNQSW